MKVLTCSRLFPKGHPKAGQDTFFVEQILNSLFPDGKADTLRSLKPEVAAIVNDFFVLDGSRQKHHTIRAGNRWKPGDMVSLRVWSDKPYRSKQIEFAQVEVKKVWKFELRPIRVHDERPIEIYGFINNVLVTDKMAVEVAKNDGLTIEDFDKWFCPDGTKYILNVPVFSGQIIAWNENINY